MPKRQGHLGNTGPNIARVLDAGTTDSGRPFFVMELVKGTPITKFCDERKLTPRQRLELFVPVCQALQHAHQKGVIHRDIKPSNVLVAMYDDKPVPKVIDFGVAKAAGHSLTDRTLMTGFGAVVGTPEYMSPEQANLNNLDIDTRSDVYSLGVVLYELLTGTTPVDRKSLGKAALLEVLRIVREVEVPRPSAKLSTITTLPSVAANRGTEPDKLSRLMKGELDWVLLKALEKDRTRRYETANALSRDIQRYLADEVVEARPPSTGYRLKKLVRRHRGPVLAAAAVAVALVAGVAAVFAVQIRANRDLAAKNDELTAEQDVVRTRSQELAAERDKVQARFDTAVKAIETFHTGVSEEALLKNPQFKELRTKLLKQAAAFYAELEKLLAGQTDARSRKALAAGYFQLAELTQMIGSKPEALALHRQALAIRRGLAADAGADLETQLDVARSLRKLGLVLQDWMGDNAGALAAYQELLDLAERLEAEHPTDAVRFQLALGHHGIGRQLNLIGKSAEALEAHRKALAIRERLANANPANAAYQFDWARSHNFIGGVLSRIGKPAEALEAHHKALAILQRAADANPAVLQNAKDDYNIGRSVANTQVFVGHLLSQTGKPREALESLNKALALSRRLTDASPAVTTFHLDLAQNYNHIGEVLLITGKPTEALEAYRQALAVLQKLTRSDPNYKSLLADAHFNIGRLHTRGNRFAEAAISLDTGFAIRQTLAEVEPRNRYSSKDLGTGYAYRGAARARAGQPAEAAADLRRALELWAKVAHLDIHAQLERSRALALLAGLGSDAKSGISAAEVTAFADRSVAALSNAVQAGWAQPEELKEPDFDPLRGRPDFQKLFASVEAKSPSRRRSPCSRGKRSERRRAPIDTDRGPGRRRDRVRRGVPHRRPRAGPARLAGRGGLRRRLDRRPAPPSADPRTTLGYVRNRDRLSRSPAYILRY
jgi:tetratricopeptide (TPR) repeat protein